MCGYYDGRWRVGGRGSGRGSGGGSVAGSGGDGGRDAGDEDMNDGVRRRSVCGETIARGLRGVRGEG